MISAQSRPAGLCRVVRLAQRWKRDDRGTTAIEFAIVGLPFFMFLFGIFGVGLYYFTTFALESGVEQASRLIRVGLVQQTGMTAAEFKQEVCKRLPAYIDCDGKMRVSVQAYPEFGYAEPPPCTDSAGNLVPPESNVYDTGSASQVVLVTVCYEWGLAKAIPFLKLGSMPDGAALLQASATFRSEPFDE